MKVSGLLSVVPIKLMPSTVPAFPVVNQPLPLPALPRFTHVMPVLYQGELVVESYTTIPNMLGMAFLEFESVRGISSPSVPDLRSKIAWEFGREPSVLMATCEDPAIIDRRKTQMSKKCFIV